MSSTELGALFIDFDNLFLALKKQYGYDESEAISKTIQIIGNTFTYIQNEMEISPIIRQAFADWSFFQDEMNELYTMGIEPKHVKSIPTKSSADIELSLSSQEVLLTRSDINSIVIIAGDRDYMPVSIRVMKKGKSIYFFSFSECLSGDLKKLIGEDNCYYYNHKTADIIPEEQLSNSKEEPAVSEDIEKDEFHELSDTQIRVIKAMIKAHKDLPEKYNTVKLSKFLVVDLKSALPELSHLERKELFNSLKEMELFETFVNPSADGHYYMTFQLDLENELVKQFLE